MSDRANTTLTIAGRSLDLWQVASVESHERLSAPTQTVVRAHTAESADCEGIIGADATIEIGLGEWARAFHGVVTKVTRTALLEDRFELSIHIESKLSLLALGRDHRIFQELSIPDVVGDVLRRAGVDDLVEWRLSASYEPHANIVQYGESDLAFVSRLLLEEGIGYLVEQRAEGEHIVFFDDNASFVPIDGDPVLTMAPSDHPRARGLQSLEDAHHTTHDAVALRDYDLAHAGVDLSVSARGDSAGRELYLHPGSYADVARGQRLSERLLERLRVRSRVLSGRSNVESVAAGRTMTVANGAHPSLDGDYLLLDVRHYFRARDGAGVGHASTLEQSNSFEAVPVTVTYRPEHAPARLAPSGVQHAFVTVPAGEEIHADDLGRVKVRFVWDRAGITDDKSSTFLRVGQLALGGSLIVPRVGFEVLVDFELGDLDRPVVSATGHLYNAELAVPYALPDAKTVGTFQTATTESGPGANELRFEDKAGAEEILVHASRDLVASVDHDTTWTVGNNETIAVGNDDTLSVAAAHEVHVASDRTLQVDGDQDATIEGSYDGGVGGDLTVAIGGNRTLTTGGDHVETTSGNLTRSVAMLQSVTGLAGTTRTIAGSSTTRVGALWAELAGTGRALNVAGSYTETIGALKMIGAADVSLGCDGAYALNAAALSVSAKGSQADHASAALAMTAGGSIVIKAKSIVVSAESKLVFRAGGTTIELGKTGTVKIKAPRVTLENADALGQIMHKSN